MSLPQPLPVPHYAVIFTSKRRSRPGDCYSETLAQMDTLVRAQPGFLSVDSVSSIQLVSGITISYWTDESSIQAWKRNLDHLLAQKKGKSEWYLRYEVRVSKVERAYTGGIGVDPEHIHEGNN
ncbi:hypothetical protein GGX14DRAFT_361264 [Mycena pura]|uniref:ABM domain-containing protein n=1 Tax=Mycena pura TaxID=153505 RepID=A0AAD6VLJ5_9AGAR|nr:hypothetical protein GGX14DRAFT_361264 [Mycena pura]